MSSDQEVIPFSVIILDKLSSELIVKSSVIKNKKTQVKFT